MADSPLETQQQLDRWHAGDPQALAELVRRDQAWIERVIRKQRWGAHAHLETADQFQDLVVEVLTYAPRFVVADRGKFRALVARMVQNNLIDRVRYQQRRPVEALSGESRLSLDPALQLTPPLAAAVRNEELAWMRLGLEFLSPEDRQLVRAHALEGQGFAELAAQLEASAGALRMRYSRILVKLTGVIHRLKNGELDHLLRESADADA